MESATDTIEQHRKPGRPYGAKQRDDIALMELKVDKTLLRALRGVPSIDPRTGDVAKDSKGKPIKKLPPAAFLKAAIMRIHSVRTNKSHPSEATPDLERELRIEATVQEALAARSSNPPAKHVDAVAQAAADRAVSEANGGESPPAKSDPVDTKIATIKSRIAELEQAGRAA